MIDYNSHLNLPERIHDRWTTTHSHRNSHPIIDKLIQEFGSKGQEGLHSLCALPLRKVSTTDGFSFVPDINAT